MWTGYYTSRPAFKGYVRESSSLLQTGRQLQALTGGAVDLSASNKLFKLEVRGRYSSSICRVDACVVHCSVRLTVIPINLD